MIWNDRMLREACENMGLVDPYDPACVNPGSIDLRLGEMIRVPNRFWGLCNSEEKLNRCISGDLKLWEEPEGFQRYVLFPGQFVLCHSQEFVRIPVDASGLLFSKSSMGRIGLEHLHAGLLDAGFNGEVAFEFHNVAPWPIELVAGKRYMQMQLYVMAEVPERDYSKTGRYQNQTGPTPARSER